MTTQEILIKAFWAQVRSSQMWIDQYNRYRDVSGVRNASLAIGKAFGIYNALQAVNGDKVDMPADMVSKTQELSSIWNELDISTTIAKAYLAQIGS